MHITELHHAPVLPPLCVDLDGTLIKSNLSVEALLRWIKVNPLRLFLALAWLARGRARLKAELAGRVELEMERLPLNDAAVEWLREQKRAGRTIVLCTSGYEQVAAKLAARLGVFDRVIAKERRVAEFGKAGFERVEKGFAAERATFHDWLRALRIHQWAKNLLLFAPIASAHRLLDLSALADVALAFVLFGCCASGTYLINDLLDLDADRRHPQKCLRPVAMGTISLTRAGAVAIALICGSVALAVMTLPPLFDVALVLYVVTTSWYSFLLKRIAMVDVLTLAGLYTLRVLAGSAAALVIPSFWLLAFAMFLFLSLAMAKRYAELRSLLDAGRDRASGRGYYVADLPLLHSFGSAAGYVCVLVLALYVNLGAPTQYSKPQFMWPVCALLLYWISRVWLKTFRGQMHLDPVVFALTDRPSLLVGVLSALLVLAAI